MHCSDLHKQKSWKGIRHRNVHLYQMNPHIGAIRSWVCLRHWQTGTMKTGKYTNNEILSWLLFVQRSSDSICSTSCPGKVDSAEKSNTQNIPEVTVIKRAKMGNSLLVDFDAGKRKYYVFLQTTETLTHSLFAECVNSYHWLILKLLEKYPHLLIFRRRYYLFSIKTKEPDKTQS